MSKGPNKAKGVYATNTGSTGRASTGIWGLGGKLGRVPIPVKYLHDAPESHNGEVRVIVPVDPEKLKAYRASPEGKRYTTKQWRKN